MPSLASVAKCIDAALPHGVSPQLALQRIARLDTAGPGDLSYCDRSHARLLPGAKCSAVITLPELANALAKPPQAALLVVENPRLGFALASQLFAPNHQLAPGSPSCISTRACIHPSAKLGRSIIIQAGTVVGAGVVLGDGCVIGPGCWLGDKVTIGPATRLASHVSCYNGVRIGAHCLVHAGAVIGADGFGFELAKDGTWQKIAQLGGVVIGDRVEIGANSCIDGGALVPTRLGNGVKLDNQIQIGHGCQIGDNCLICAHSAVAGSVEMEEGCILAGSNSIKFGVRLAAGTVVTGCSMITSHTRGGVYSGAIPAKPQRVWLQFLKIIGRLARGSG